MKVTAEYIEMPICEHLVPVKFPCFRCNLKNNHNEYTKTLDLTLLECRIGSLERALNRIEKFLSNVDVEALVESAQQAESIFAKKVHDLQSVDKKRDDVINALCQKVEALTNRVMEYYPHPLIGKLEAFIDKL